MTLEEAIDAVEQAVDMLESEVESMRDAMIEAALRTHSSPRAAAKALGIGRASIYRWIAARKALATSRAGA